MPTKEEEMQIFIPAKALEHPSNPEEYELKDKIKWALIRYYINDDFFGFIEVRDKIPIIIVEKTQFNPIELGYFVIASVRCL